MTIWKLVPCLALLIGGAAWTQQMVAAEPAQAAQAAAPAASDQPDLAAVKADFVPGEKTLFYDDFTDMTGDEPPPHWKVRGIATQLRVGGGVRQLTAVGDRGRLTPNIKGIPKNFTLEGELKFEEPGDLRSNWFFISKDGGEYDLRLVFQSQGTDALRIRLSTIHDDLADIEPKVDLTKPIKVALWVQNGRIRVYVNNERLVDVNQVELPVLASADMEIENYGGEKSAVGYRMVRIAESTPDFSQVISSAGRYVTHGILFDTDSDRLKPESAAVIKSIARGLETNPNLKLGIEGYTDSTGAADHNVDLSRRRAEAVKAVLVSQFSVDAGRLTAAGLGAAKPVDSNDTPQGRAQNRRVEFVKH
jgi:outer membrane protein OmpA-like peptidoglycan-associated protein